MAKKAPRPLRIAPLQRVVAEPITDPAEQAALDALHQRQSKRMAAYPTADNGQIKAGPARVLGLCRQLGGEERLQLLTKLASQSSAESQLECLAHLLVELPPSLLHQVEEEIRPQLAK